MAYACTCRHAHNTHTHKHHFYSVEPVLKSHNAQDKEKKGTSKFHSVSFVERVALIQTDRHAHTHTQVQTHLSFVVMLNVRTFVAGRVILSSMHFSHLFRNVSISARLDDRKL